MGVIPPYDQEHTILTKKYDYYMYTLSKYSIHMSGSEFHIYSGSLCLMDDLAKPKRPPDCNKLTMKEKNCFSWIRNSKMNSCKQGIVWRVVSVFPD